MRRNEFTSPNSGALHVQTLEICGRKTIHPYVDAAVLVRMHDRGADNPDRHRVLLLSGGQPVSRVGAFIFQHGASNRDSLAIALGHAVGSV